MVRYILSLCRLAEEVPLASLPPPGAGVCSVHITVGWHCMVIVCIVTPSGPVEMVKEELKKQLPPRLLIPNNCIRLLETVGQGKCGAHNVWRMRRLHALCGT